MNSISEIIISSISSIPASIQLFVISLFSFAEGLPIVGSILPGGTIAILAGTLVEKGLLTPLLTVVVIGMSSFIGDMTGFFIGKKFKHLKWVRNLVDNEKHQKSWDFFDRHLMLISIFGKLIPVIRSTPSIFAAVRGVKARRYILYSFIGSVLWAAVGVFAGKFLEEFFGDNTISILLIAIVASISFVLVRMVIKNLYKKYK
ncbi:MAG: hypothetical protein RL687_385 [Candidatus Parcubacteria bacterium]|jgi:membrane protein DedA with SNARE-associated domain